MNQEHRKNSEEFFQKRTIVAKPIIIDTKVLKRKGRKEHKEELFRHCFPRRSPLSQ
jgi:hypothetical protein